MSWQPTQSKPPALGTLPPARLLSHFHFFMFRAEKSTELHAGARHVRQGPRDHSWSVPQQEHDGTAAMVDPPSTSSSRDELRSRRCRFVSRGGLDVPGIG